MAYIQTVLGKIDPDSVGFCHSHEHLLLSKGVSFEKSPVLLLDDFEKSLKELESFKAAGGDTIVEAQPVGCNRVADGLKKLAELTGVNLIASTGFHKLIFYPEDHWIFQMTEEELSRIFVHELTEGMYVECDNARPETCIDARAGQIKCALDTVGLTERYQVLFRAACLASAKTGAPMMIHIENGADPLELFDFLKQQGQTGNLIFCHMDRACRDLKVHKALAAEGVFLEYDTIARPKYHDDEREIEIMMTLLEAGLENRILVGLDTTRARLKTYTPNGPGLGYIKETFLPMLREKKISETQIEKMIRYNPRAAFAWQD